MKMCRLFSDTALGKVKDITTHGRYIIWWQGECFLRLLFVPIVGRIKEIDDWSEVGEASTWGFSSNFPIMNVETNELLAGVVMHYNGGVYNGIWIVFTVFKSLDSYGSFV